MTSAYEEPTIRVGISRVYEKVVAIEQHLAVMTCDVKALRETTREEIGDLETRTRALEEGRFPWVKIGGLVAVLALAATVIFGILTLADPGPPPPPPPRPSP